MKRQFAELVEKYTPKANEVVMNGLATVVIPHVKDYLDVIFHNIAKSFPEGLVYCGSERCSPLEEYQEITRNKNSRQVFELAKNSIYLCKYKFTYFDEPLPLKYLYLPYVDDAGLMSIRGSLYHVTPILTDTVISPDNKSKIFVRLLRVKLNFERSAHIYVVDGKTTRVNIIHAKIYNKEKSDKIVATSNAVTTNLHYLLAKYGFEETFKKYLGFVPIIGTSDINTTTYPPSKWVICESSQIKPSDYKDKKEYIPSDIKLAVPRSEWNENVHNVIGTFFYIVDYFPDIKHDWVNYTTTWMCLLGNIIFSSDFGKGRLYDLIKEHLVSLDNYLDDIVRVKIIEIGYDVKDFYDLLYVIMKNFDNLIKDTVIKGNSLYNRNFEILYYMTYLLTNNFVNMNYEINKKVSKKGKRLKLENVNNLINKHFKTGGILSVNYDNSCMNGVNCSSDNKYPKITSICGIQSSSDGSNPGRGKSGTTVVDSSKHLHVSSIEIGSLLALSKSNPHPAARCNMFVDISVPDGKIIRKPEIKELLDSVQEDLRRRSPNPTGQLEDTSDVEDDEEVDDSVMDED